MGVTSRNYQLLQKAYAHFNRSLFGGILPEVLITHRIAGKARGYFWAGEFRGRVEEQRVDEIALNADLFVGRSDEDILSTLVHEMCHVWQQHFGTPSRGSYHNTEWAAEMALIGLMPSNTGLVGGKVTGASMTHYVLPNGQFQKAFRRFVSQRDFKLAWEANTPLEVTVIEGGTDGTEDDQAIDMKKKVGKKASKTKFTCPQCGQNAWAKPASQFMCGNDSHGQDGDGHTVLFVMTEST